MMDSSRHGHAGSYQVQVHRLAIQFALSCGAACLCGMAWAGSWTHDSTSGAATVVALPGGQVALARDGADLQTRTITYESVQGDATTITCAYGPSGRKAIEAQNGTVRQHVYGTELAPLLRVEGDGSLTYQVGMDTISVDATGGMTVAYRITDIKRSTVAVLDAKTQAQQRVAYSTLGQSRGQQQSSSVYVKAGQLSGYEGLSLVLLSKDVDEGLGEEPFQDQLIDNRARFYFSLAGRFLALDPAGKARAYEARGNNWIAHADYDGNMTELLAVLGKKENIGLVATFLVPEKDKDNQIAFLKGFWEMIKKLDEEKKDHYIGSDVLLTAKRGYNKHNIFSQYIGENRVRKLVTDDRLGFVDADGLINYGSKEFAGSNKEKVKILFITKETFAEYLKGREEIRNFVFISMRETSKKFLEQDFWKGKPLEINAIQQELDLDFINWHIKIDIYTLGNIYKQYSDLEKLGLKQRTMEGMEEEEAAQKDKEITKKAQDIKSKILTSMAKEEEKENKQPLFQASFKGENEKVKYKKVNEDSDDENEKKEEKCILQ